MEDQFITEIEILISELRNESEKRSKGNKAAFLRYRLKMMKIKKLATAARVWATEQTKK